MLFLRLSTSVKSVSWLVALAAGMLAVPAEAQVAPSAFERAKALWIGGEYSNIHAGFPYLSDQRLWGAGVFGDFHLTGHIGIEAEARFLRFNSFYGESQVNYLAGPRYLAGRFGKVQPYAQCLVGIGKMHYPFDIGTEQYFAIAPGGGANYRVSRKWSLRGEFEYQLWPESPNFSNEPKHEITPYGFHVGIAYRLFR